MARLICTIIDPGTGLEEAKHTKDDDRIQFNYPRISLVREFLAKMGWELEPGMGEDEDEILYERKFPYEVSISTEGSGGRPGQTTIRRCRRIREVARAAERA